MPDSARSPPQPVPVEFDPFAPADESFELTEAQREMCAATLMGEEANCAYNQCFVITLQGPLSPESLHTALSEVVQRHGALRLRIDLHAERQHLLSAIEVNLPVVDLRAEDEAARKAEIERLIDHETRTPFDLGAAPLWRALLLREADDRHRLVFTAHHLIVDGWSSAVLFSDLARSYAADRFGLEPTLPPAAPYAEFMRRQLGPEVAAEMEAATEYWVRRFSDGVSALELPTDAPRPALKTYAAGRQVLALDKELYQALRKLAAQRRATLFVGLLAAFEVLLARLAGAGELVIGVPMASQALEDNGHLVAHGVNTLPLLCRADPRHSFTDHLESTRNAFYDAQAHQRLTFGTLAQKLRLARDPGRTPLVSILFNIDKLGSPFDFGEVSVASVDAPKSFYNFELGINAIDDGESLLIECDYNADLFDTATIGRWLSHYRELLKGIVADPRAPIAELPLLTPEERRQILFDWNATRRRTDGDMRLHRLFEAQAARAPQAEALITTTGRYSYAELNARANRIAHQLRRLGVGRDLLVGVCLQRSVNLVVALLAVLKSGGAYVPLDPNYPSDRIAFMLKDSQARVLITTSDLTDALPAGDAHVLLIDRDSGFSDCPVADPENVTQPHDLAYVIYTSGSTGVPKGVAIEHFSATTLVHWAATVFPDTALRGVLASTSVCFDLSIFEIFFTLARGGRVILAENVLELPEHPARDEITLINTVPSAVSELLRAGGLPHSVATVCLAGEPLPTRLVDRLYATGHVKQVYDLYGPSEATTYSTWARRGRGLPATIGHPIANTRAYVLDPCMNPTPVGVAGELFLGGDGLARGYLNRPELTAERFVRDPFLEGTGNRIYRTGDLARYRPDGELEYLGRLDHQVKLRGFRIELGEIEAAIASHSAVREVAVEAREDMSGEKKIIAYFTAEANAGLVTELREALRLRLPEYMIPAAFVRLDAFPRTPSGKLDRRTLPAPETVAESRDIEAPRSASESLVVGAFNEVLNRSDVGVSDNFFDLGGHSLMAVRVMALLSASARVDLPLRNLFERPTPEQLAAAIDALAWAAGKRDRATLGDQGNIEEIEL